MASKLRRLADNVGRQREELAMHEPKPVKVTIYSDYI